MAKAFPDIKVGVSINYNRIERSCVEQIECLEVRKLEGWEKR